MWEKPEKREFVKLDFNEIKAFQNMLKNFQEKIINMQGKYNILSNSKKVLYI